MWDEISHQPWFPSFAVTCCPSRESRGERNATGGLSCAGEAPTEGEVGQGEPGRRLEASPWPLAQRRGCSELGWGVLGW